MTEKRLILTDDGSHSIYHPDLDETYHSTYGALTESHYVFIEHGLKHCKASDIHLLEVGMGTGLNLWLTAMTKIGEWPATIKITSLEPDPLPPTVTDQLNYANLKPMDSAHDILRRIHQLPWEEPHQLIPEITLTKHKLRFENFVASENSFNLIYFDAFAPNKQEDIWIQENLKKAFFLLKAGGFLVTYCAQGKFRRQLTAAGFKVESLPGPPRKREMTRATKPYPQPQEKTDRSSPHPQKV